MLYQSANIGVERYRSPVSGRSATMTLPGVFRALCKLCCRKDCCAGGDAHQNALAACQRAAGRKRVLVLHGENLIVNVGVQRIRHKARADALNFMRARLAAGENRGGSRFHRDNLNIGVLRLEVRAYTGERAARADACNENIELAVRVCPDFRPVVFRCTAGFAGFVNWLGM